MKTCRLNGETLASLAEVHGAIARGLALPDHYGANLDALWDALTVDLEGPAELVWEHSGRSRARLGADYDRLAATLRAVAEERPDFSLRFD